MNRIVTIIEFLKMIEDNNTPEKIIFRGKKYKKEINGIDCEYDYYNDDDECLFEDYLDYNTISELVKEYVTIVEDKPIIEPINIDRWAEITYEQNWKLLTHDFNLNINTVVDKINQIIDYINRKEDK